MNKIEKKEIEKIEKIISNEMDNWEIDSIIDVLYSDQKGKNKTEILKNIIEYLLNDYSNNTMDKNDYASGYADLTTPIFNSDILNWYSKDSLRIQYADDGISEYEIDINEGIIKILQIGIYICIERFVLTVLELYNKEVD